MNRFALPTVSLLLQCMRDVDEHICFRTSGVLLHSFPRRFSTFALMRTHIFNSWVVSGLPPRPFSIFAFALAWHEFVHPKGQTTMRDFISYSCGDSVLPTRLVSLFDIAIQGHECAHPNGANRDLAIVSLLNWARR